MKIPRNTGRDTDNPDRPEIEHFGNARFAAAGRHARPQPGDGTCARLHGEQPLDLTGKPKPEEQ
ncbi:hypothetical protein [Bradyrhizobium sp. sGM-13]|uniref:hypothetical protein n=1 Tax=Bradyrhizobium sp. sGM-13 TaxID=2831781 RepID=UPI001BCB5824|nr:hypothetical protein [Bradyrhizobium sp. sGM-13]